MLAIETTQLAKNYGELAALNHVDLRVEQGSIFGLLGPNGAGKTTLIHLLLGFKRPTSGRALVLGYDVTHDQQHIVKSVGYVSEANNLYGYMKVKDILRFGAKLRPRWCPEVETSLLDIFQLPLGTKISNLSQGMIKQLSLLLALAPQPELLVLDEPTSGLDPTRKRQFYALLMDTIAESQRSALVSSHDIGELERVAETIGILNKGKLVKQGEIANLKERHRKIIVVWENNTLPAAINPSDFIVATRSRDGMWTLITDDASLVGCVQQTSPRYVQVYRLSMEDIFRLYTSQKEERFASVE